MFRVEIFLPSTVDTAETHSEMTQKTPLLEAFGHITVVALKPVRVPS